MKYGPSSVWSLTRDARTAFGGQFDWGGRLQKRTEASKGALRPIGNRPKSVMAEGCLTGRPTSRSGGKPEHSDPVVPYGRAIAQRIKGTPGITG